jgi:transcriptional antiterminator
MDLDNRSVQILQAVASTVKISSKEIMEKYDLTRNQLDYAIKKINDYLEENNYRKSFAHVMAALSLIRKWSMFSLEL